MPEESWTLLEELAQQSHTQNLHKGLARNLADTHSFAQFFKR